MSVHKPKSASRKTPYESGWPGFVVTGIRSTLILIGFLLVSYRTFCQVSYRDSIPSLDILTTQIRQPNIQRNLIRVLQNYPLVIAERNVLQGLNQNLTAQRDSSRSNYIRLDSLSQHQHRQDVKEVTRLKEGRNTWRNTALAMLTLLGFYLKSR